MRRCARLSVPLKVQIFSEQRRVHGLGHQVHAAHLVDDNDDVDGDDTDNDDTNNSDDNEGSYVYEGHPPTSHLRDDHCRVLQPRLRGP